MQIRSIRIGKYCLLDDFRINFEKNLSILIGENGSGKSTLLEFLALAFGHLHKYFIDGDKTASFIEDYDISFQAKGKDGIIYDVEINSFNYQKKDKELGVFNHVLKINNIEYLPSEAEEVLSHIGGFKTLLPSSIVIYYAGITKRLEELSDYFDKRYTRKLIKIDNTFKLNPLNLPEERPFFYCRPNHVANVLLSLLVSEETVHKSFIDDNFDIDNIDTEIIFNFKKPKWRKGKKESDTFWGASEGAILDFLTILSTMSQDSNFDKNEIKISYYSTLNLKDALSKLSINSPELFLFRMLDILIYDDLLKSINIAWTGKSGDKIEIDRLSEGQKQLLLTSGLSELWSLENTLFIYDEPDTFLHPKWQADFVKELSTKNPDNQFIIATHSPQLINSSNNSELFILEKGKIKEHSQNFYGRDVNSILLHYMDAPKRPKNIDLQIKEISALIDKKEYKIALEELKKLKELVSDNDSDYTRLHTKLNFLIS